jgi:shikimate dehydrogenase
MTNRYAVLGSPISHSKSPMLHQSAYRVLGLDCEYSAVEVPAARLRQFIETLDASWKGFSITMPLKEEAARFASQQDEVVTLTGVANTLNLEESGWKAYNTDVFGIQQSLGSALTELGCNVVVIGSGATATSALYAAILSNPSAKLTLLARDRSKAKAIRDQIRASGFRLRVGNFANLNRTVSKADVVISTLPSGALDGYAAKLAKSKFYSPHGTLLDVAYDPWPSEVAKLWKRSELTAVSGLEMLMFQAIAQLRIFNLGSTTDPLPNERAIELAMRDSLGLI